MRVKASIILVFLFHLSVHASSFCGEYKASAFVEEGEENTFILNLNFESTNNTRIIVREPLLKKFKNSVVDILIEVESFCSSQCDGKLKKIFQVHDPTKPFFPFIQLPKHRVSTKGCK